MVRPFLAIAVLLALVSSCGGGVSPSSSQTSSATTSPTTTAAPRPPADQAVVDAALADLAQRLNVSEGQIEVRSFARVTWSDGSLGCPKPGEVYTQALVQGSRTILVHDGHTYDYHAGSDGMPFLCERPTLSSGPGLTVPTPTDR